MDDLKETMDYINEIRNAPQIYVAGALSGKTLVESIKNYNRMFSLAKEIRKLGFFTFIPGDDLVFGIFCGDLEYQHYFENSVKSLLSCDAMIVTPGSNESEGVKKERNIARHLKKPVFESIDELKEKFEIEDRKIKDCKRCICWSKSLEDGYFYCSFPKIGKIKNKKDKDWMLLGETYHPMVPPKSCFMNILNLECKSFIKEIKK